MERLDVIGTYALARLGFITFQRRIRAEFVFAECLRMVSDGREVERCSNTLWNTRRQVDLYAPGELTGLEGIIHRIAEDIGIEGLGRVQMQLPEAGIPKGIAGHRRFLPGDTHRRRGGGSIRLPGRLGFCGSLRWRLILCIGYDSGDAVSSLYETPGDFEGGTIDGVAVTVSGEPYFNLEAEAKRMLMQH